MAGCAPHTNKSDAQVHPTIVSTLILCTNMPPFDSADATLRVNGQGKSQGKIPLVLSVAARAAESKHERCSPSTSQLGKLYRNVMLSAAKHLTLRPFAEFILFVLISLLGPSAFTHLAESRSR